jgi:hypothetical protein
MMCGFIVMQNKIFLSLVNYNTVCGLMYSVLGDNNQ